MVTCTRNAIHPRPHGGMPQWRDKSHPNSGALSRTLERAGGRNHGIAEKSWCSTWQFRQPVDAVANLCGQPFHRSTTRPGSVRQVGWPTKLVAV
jgi:hypothetical protein